MALAVQHWQARIPQEVLGAIARVPAPEDPEVAAFLAGLPDAVPLWWEMEQARFAAYPNQPWLIFAAVKVGALSSLLGLLWQRTDAQVGGLDLPQSQLFGQVRALWEQAKKQLDETWARARKGRTPLIAAILAPQPSLYPGVAYPSVAPGPGQPRPAPYWWPDPNRPALRGALPDAGWLYGTYGWRSWWN